MFIFFKKNFFSSLGYRYYHSGGGYGVDGKTFQSHIPLHDNGIGWVLFHEEVKIAGVSDTLSRFHFWSSLQEVLSS